MNTFLSFPRKREFGAAREAREQVQWTCESDERHASVRERKETFAPAGMGALDSRVRGNDKGRKAAAP